MKIVHIVGAGRSGTTLLYKLLCLHPDVVYLNRYNKKLPNIPLFSFTNRMLKNHLFLKRKIWFREDGHAYFIPQSIARFVPTPIEGERFYKYCGLKLYQHEYSEPEIDYARKTFRKLIKKQVQIAGGKVFVTR